MGKWREPSDAATATRRAVEQRLFGRPLKDDERLILGHRLGWVGRVLTQQEVADKAGLGQAGVSGIERRLVQAMNDLRSEEQEALDSALKSKALAKAVDQIRDALHEIDRVRSPILHIEFGA